MMVVKLIFVISRQSWFGRGWWRLCYNVGGDEREAEKKKNLVKVVVVVNKYRWLDFFIVLDFFSILFFSHFALICFLYFFGAFLYYFSPLLDFV